MESGEEGGIAMQELEQVFPEGVTKYAQNVKDLSEQPRGGESDMYLIVSRGSKESPDT